MSNNFFDIEADRNLQDILTAQLKPHVERFKRNCPSLSDKLFIESGINWIMSENNNCRDFLQHSEEVHNNKIARTTFSEAMHSPRRLDFVSNVSQQYYESLNKLLLADKVDYLKEFKELDEYGLFSIDGHYIEHCSHTERNEKGKVYAAGNLYALNMRSGLMQHFDFVSDGTGKNHEMPIFRKRVKIENDFNNFKDQKTIFINDRAFMDFRWWATQKQKGNFVISRVKENNTPIKCGDIKFDKNDPINAGVVANRQGGFTSSGIIMRIIDYINPETGEEMTFYTTLGNEIRPGLVCWLYFLRWQIEKVFDSFKNAFQMTKAWATKNRATQIQGHFICLVYNFVQFLSEKTKKHESCEDEKAMKKYAMNLEVREVKAKELGRYIHPLIYINRRISQISRQFIRAVKNHFYLEMPLRLVIPVFADRLKRYL